jgi:hypothetical protein
MTPPQAPAKVTKLNRIERSAWTVRGLFSSTDEDGHES